MSRNLDHGIAEYSNGNHEYIITRQRRGWREIEALRWYPERRRYIQKTFFVKAGSASHRRLERTLGCGRL
jgi:hypothetical protein